LSKSIYDVYQTSGIISVSPFEGEATGELGSYWESGAEERLPVINSQLRAISDRLDEIEYSLRVLLRLFQIPVKGVKLSRGEMKGLTSVSIADKLLGKFEDKDEKLTSTELIKTLRESGYGKY
jgi:hypothetical protein